MDRSRHLINFHVHRYDKTVIDSRAAAENRNEYALAHLCNHGGGRGAGSGSNVMAVAYNFPQDPLGWGGFPEELRPYIPNSYAKRRWVACGWSGSGPR